MKNAEQLMEEAEELQRKIAPELYGDGASGDGTSDDDNDDGTSGDAPAPGDDDDKTPETEEEKAARLEAEETAKRASEDSGPDPRDAEIARLKDELSRVKATAGRVAQTAEANDRLRERIVELEREIASKKDAPSDTGAGKSATDDEVLTEMIEEYGEDSTVVKAFKRQQAELSRFQKTISDISTVSARSSQDKFIDSVRSSVSDYEAIRDNPEFAAFLGEPVSPLSKRTVYEELKDAAANLDAVTTANIYKAFKDKTSTPASDKTTTPPKKDKARLLAPGSTGKADSGKEPPVVYTLAEIEQMSKEMNNLRMKGNHKAADKIKAKIDAFTDGLGSFG